MFRACFVLLFIYSCSAVIDHLNDTEYARMPPLWELAPFAPCLAANGTYCVLQLNLVTGPGDHLMQTVHQYSEQRLKHFNHSVVERGVCVPDACRARGGGGGDSLEACVSSSAGGGRLSALRYCVQHDERAHADACRARGGGGGDSLEACVSSSAGGGRLSALRYCVQHDERAHADAWDCAVRALLLALVALNAAGTAYDYYVTKTRGKISNNAKYDLLLSFSVRRNWDRLIKTEPLDALTQDFQYMHGIRMVCILATMILHVLVVLAMGYTQNPHDIEKTFEKPFYFLLYNGLMIVQIFFFMSGFFKSYDLQKEAETKQITLSGFPKTMILRLSRLVPTLAFTLAVVTSWARHAGSGPLWKLYIDNSLVSNCRLSWWHNLLFINNYTDQGKFCLMQTWHLAAEVQVFMVSVFVYLVSPRLLYPILLVSSVAPALHTVLQDLDAVIVTPEYFRTWDCPAWSKQHILGHNNLPCFIMGMITAKRYYEWRKKGGHLTTSLWWVLAQYAVVFVPLLMYSGRWFYDVTERPSVEIRAAYVTAIRPALGLICTLAAFAYLSRTSSLLKSLFSWRHWVIPSRLSYCVFLIHMPLSQMISAARTQLTYYSFANVMIAYVFVVTVSFALAVPLHLMVEAPFTTLFKHLLKNNTLKVIERGTTDVPEQGERKQVKAIKNDTSSVKRRLRIHN